MSTAIGESLQATIDHTVVAAVEEHGWELLVVSAASGGWLASLAGTHLHHPLRASGPSPAVALDELARLVTEWTREHAAVAEAQAARRGDLAPLPREVFTVRFEDPVERRMVGVLCADLTEARSLARARDGHIIRTSTEVVM